MAAYFAKCEEKLGFVPNVLKAYAFDMAKLSAFVAMYNDLMLAPSGLSKLEREMIAVAVSAHNRCYYCLVAHGAAVRALSGDPALGELMVMNYRAARLSPRERAMLDFAVKLSAEPWRVEEEDRAALRRGRLHRSRHLGHRRGRRLLQHVQPDCVRDRHAAEQRLSRASKVNALRECAIYRLPCHSRIIELGEARHACSPCARPDRHRTGVVFDGFGLRGVAGEACTERHPDDVLQRSAVHRPTPSSLKFKMTFTADGKMKRGADRHRQPRRGHLEAVERRLLHHLERLQGQLFHGGQRRRQQMVGAAGLDRHGDVEQIGPYPGHSASRNDALQNRDRHTRAELGTIPDRRRSAISRKDARERAFARCTASGKRFTRAPINR